MIKITFKITYVNIDCKFINLDRQLTSSKEEEGKKN